MGSGNILRGAVWRGPCWQTTSIVLKIMADGNGTRKKDSSAQVDTFVRSGAPLSHDLCVIMSCYQSSLIV